MILFAKLGLDIAHMPLVAYITFWCLSGYPFKYWTGSLLLNLDDLAGTCAFRRMILRYHSKKKSFLFIFFFFFFFFLGDTRNKMYTFGAKYALDITQKFIHFMERP